MENLNCGALSTRAVGFYRIVRLARGRMRRRRRVRVTRACPLCLWTAGRRAKGSHTAPTEASLLFDATFTKSTYFFPQRTVERYHHCPIRRRVSAKPLFYRNQSWRLFHLTNRVTIVDTIRFQVHPDAAPYLSFLLFFSLRLRGSWRGRRPLGAQGFCQPARPDLFPGLNLTWINVDVPPAPPPGRRVLQPLSIPNFACRQSRRSLYNGRLEESQSDVTMGTVCDDS